MTDPTDLTQHCRILKMPRTQHSAMKSTGGKSIKMPPPKPKSTRGIRDVVMSSAQSLEPLRRQPERVASVKLADVCYYIFWPFRYWFLYSGAIPAWMAETWSPVTSARGSYAPCGVSSFLSHSRIWRSLDINLYAPHATTTFTAQINHCLLILYVELLSSLIYD
jgi:hypothetical protein